MGLSERSERWWNTGGSGMGGLLVKIRALCSNGAAVVVSEMLLGLIEFYTLSKESLAGQRF